MASRLRGKETLISQMMMHLMMYGNTRYERIFAAKIGKRPLMKVHRRPETLGLIDQKGQYSAGRPAALGSVP